MIAVLAAIGDRRVTAGQLEHHGNELMANAILITKSQPCAMRSTLIRITTTTQLYELLR